jgi:hypothetical protein
VFCPRCGTPHERDAAFCEQCGERLAVEAVPAAAGAGPRPLLLVAGVLAVAAVVAGVLALAGVFSDGDRAVSRVALPAARPAVTAEPAPIPQEDELDPPAATTTAPAPEPAPGRSVPATVARTCGRGGVGGDCHLSVRARPSSDAGELERHDEGDALRLSCQVRGDAVQSSALGVSSTVWSRTVRGGYVSNVYVKGPGLKAQVVTLRRC